jgi:hypothetical protein
LLYPALRRRSAPTMTLPQRQQMALSRSADHGLPFSTWSLTKLAKFLVAEGVVNGIRPRGTTGPAPQGRRLVPGVKPSKQSNDADYEAKKDRVLELLTANNNAEPGPGNSTVVLCMDELGPPQSVAPPRQALGTGGTKTEKGSTAANRGRRRSATYTRTHGVRHLMAALDLGTDKMYGQHQGEQEPELVLGLLPVVPVPTSGTNGHRARQLQTPPSKSSASSARGSGCSTRAKT